MDLQALIFDFDGTILDTEMPDYESWQEIFQAHGATLDLDLWSTCVGGAADTFDPYAILETHTGRIVDRQRIREMRRARFRELVATQPIRPGVLSWLESAKSAGIRLTVASSSDAAWVHEHLSRLHLIDWFESIHTRDDVERVKPDPALYHLSVSHLNVPAHHVIVIEDSRNGLLAAKRAGLKCLVVPNQITQHLDFSEADILLDSLADHSLSSIVNQLGMRLHTGAATSE